MFMGSAIDTNAELLTMISKSLVYASSNGHLTITNFLIFGIVKKIIKTDGWEPKFNDGHTNTYALCSVNRGENEKSRLHNDDVWANGCDFQCVFAWIAGDSKFPIQIEHNLVDELALCRWNGSVFNVA